MPKAKNARPRKKPYSPSTTERLEVGEIAERFQTRVVAKATAIVKGEEYLNGRKFSPSEAKARKRALVDALRKNYHCRPELMAQVVNTRKPTAIVQCLWAMDEVATKIRAWYAAISRVEKDGERRVIPAIRHTDNAVKAGLLMGESTVNFRRLETVLREREEALAPFKEAWKKLDEMFESRKRRVEELSRYHQQTIDFVVFLCQVALDNCTALYQNALQRDDAALRGDDAMTLRCFRALVMDRLETVLSVAKSERHLRESGVPSMETTALTLMQQAKDRFEPERIDEIVRACWRRTKRLGGIHALLNQAYQESSERRHAMCEPVPPPFYCRLPLQQLREPLEKIASLKGCGLKISKDILSPRP